MDKYSFDFQNGKISGINNYSRTINCSYSKPVKVGKEIKIERKEEDISFYGKSMEEHSLNKEQDVRKVSNLNNALNKKAEKEFHHFIKTNFIPTMQRIINIIFNRSFISKDARKNGDKINAMLIRLNRNVSLGSDKNFETLVKDATDIYNILIDYVNGSFMQERSDLYEISKKLCYLQFDYTIDKIGKIEHALDIIVEGATMVSSEALKNKGLRNVTIGREVNIIGEGAFEDNDIENVNFLGEVGVIGKNSFKGNKLKSIIIPASVTSICKGAFESNDISDVMFQNGSNLTYIGSKAFSNNEIKAIDLPLSVTKIYSDTFDDATKVNADFIIKDQKKAYVKKRI